MANSSKSLAMSQPHSSTSAEERAVLDPDNVVLNSYHPELIQPEADLDSIRSWYTECKSHHGDSGNTRYTSELAKHVDHVVLIDVNAGCLKSLPVSTTFVALSYVWGQAKTTKLRRSNFEQLKRPGALHYESQEFDLPDTVRDAIYVCQVLGAEYLWVDCLCVLQDASDAEMSKTLGGMAYIYANAEYTIVAAEGLDANHGLTGIRGRARQIYVDDGTMDDIYPYLSSWAQRGWTFQESLFSRRLLVFDWTKVAWLCGRCVWSEAEKASFPRLEILPGQRLHSFYPDFESAFAGATEIMASTFPGGLLYGLPVFFFDIALLWEVNFEKAHRAGKPSWSWTGWKTFALCMSWSLYNPKRLKALLRPPYPAAIHFLKPVAKWDTGVNIEHFNGFYAYQALREDPDAALPDGWQRVEHPAVALYTHVSKMDDHEAYLYPLPLALPGAQSALPILPTILTCTAPIATFFIGNIVDRSKDLFHSVTLLFVYRGKSIGCLKYKSYENKVKKKWWQLYSRACELVAISETKIARYRCMWMDNGDSADDPANESADLVPIYNVLWIEWEGDIAYRKDIGIVSKEAWDALEPEVRTFKFG